MKKKCYFFVTSLQQRDGVLKKPTLRALPGQTMEDGTPIDETLNVQAPKEAGSSPGGARLDYPTGTIFGSDTLRLCTDKKTPYYSVYPEGKKEGDTINFHPINVTNAAFFYQRPEHVNQKFEAAYVLFENGIEPILEEEEELPAPSKEKTAVYTPADENGNARPADADWKERYPGQLEDESQMFSRWLRNIYQEKKIPLASRIVMSTVMPLFEELHRAGETIDTLASRSRFNDFISSEKISMEDLAILPQGPHKVYFDWLKKEHDLRKQCTATERNYDNNEDLMDALGMVSGACDAAGIPNGYIPNDIDNFRKAFQEGWTLGELLDPENIMKSTSMADYAVKLATKQIPLPEKFQASGASYIDMLLSDKKNRIPKDKDGFHVEEKIWKQIVWALNRRCNTLLVGPTGSGKTELIKLLCERTGTACTVIQMGSITDPTEQLVGKMDIDSLTGGTVFDWADFAQAIQKPGVIILDEVNRIPKNGENVLFSCLDRSRELSASGAKSSDKRTIKVHPDCCFMATANIGDQYTGTKTIDAAIMTRFNVKVETEYLPQKTEEKILMSREGINADDAKNIAFVANKIRTMANKRDIQTSISMRETLTCANMVKDGFSVKEAMELVFLPMYDKGEDPDDPRSERAQVKQVISQRFSNK